MNKKVEFITRINELIECGKNTVLTSKGKPQKIINKNAKNGILNDNALFLISSTYEERQELINANKHRFTKTYISINHSTGFEWVLEVHSCLQKYLGYDHGRTFDVEDIKQLEKIDKKHIEKVISILNATRISIERGEIEINDIEKDKNDIDYLSILNNLFSRFHLVARQLRSRYNSRTTLLIKDEFDAQDLLHALLQLYFEDIRKEEWAPSYAGSSSRMDFLLKNEKVVIELKKTRKGLGDKELGEQLIVDIEKYKVHPDCKHLICFVYDSEDRLKNPRGIEKDLNKKHGNFVEVIIKP